MRNHIVIKFYFFLTDLMNFSKTFIQSIYKKSRKVVGIKILLEHLGILVI